MSIVESLILGIIQGLTEWFPVSSSGHLTIAKEFAEWNPPVFFFVLLHLATLTVLIVFFRKVIAEVLKALARGDFNSEEGKLGILIITGNIPTAIIGYTFRDILKSFFSNLLVVGIALLATGFLLYTSRTRGDNRPIGHLDALLMGLAQALAIVPGISRSGATISIGFLRKIDKKKVFEFSFLLSIPAILGATIVESADLPLLITDGGDILALVVGIAASIIVGYVSLKTLRRVVMEEKFHWFAPYCWIAGILIIFSQIH